MGLFPVAAGQRITSAVINHMYGLSDTTVHTVTAATLTDLSSVYTIPANDAAPGVVYELVTWGNGTWGSTQQTLQLQTTLAGNPLGAGTVLGLNLFSASQIFRWEATCRVTCITTGTAGTWQFMHEGNANVYGANILPGTQANASAGFNDSNTATQTQDTTVACTFSLRAAWGSATGAPTLTCRGTGFKRIG